MTTQELRLLPAAEVWRDSRGKVIQAHGGGVMHFDGVYYWFGENREVETIDGNVSGISCYSSIDLLNWNSEGIVLPVVKDDPNHDLFFRNVIERPKVIYNRKTATFVMIFHSDSPDYKRAKIAVATSGSPTGPYQYRESLRPNHSESRDMTIYQDEDESAYLVYSSEGNSTMHIARLSDDYLQVMDDFVRVFEGQYREAPAVLKWRGKYFLITSGCTGWKPNAAQYAVADTMMGPWTVIGNPCVGSNAETTFQSQSTFVLQVGSRYVLMADRWNPGALYDSRYVWLPICLDSPSTLRIFWDAHSN